MHNLTVDLGNRTYHINIAAGILERAGNLIREVSSSSRVLLVSNPTVFPLYGQVVRESLENAGFRVSTALMPDGEEYKNLTEASKIIDKAVDMRLERSSLLVALGGGVVGDLAGFAASVYQRGIDFVQIPTTLLSQVDSSVGGKVAVNHLRGKNLIGSFHQPKRVIIDPLTLNTLEDREYKSGLGEVVKYGLVYSKDFFLYMEDHADKIAQKDTICIEELIYKSCEIKSRIVGADERETGLRAILNLGHTFGHSVEKLTDYKIYRHGESVVMGTVAAAYLALELGILNQQELQRIMRLYHKLGIYQTFPLLDEDEVYQGMLNDKKVVNEKLRLILPRGIGNYAIVEDISKEQIIRAIRNAQQQA